MYFSELEQSLRDIKASYPLIPGEHLTSDLSLDGNLALTSRPYDERLGDTFQDIDPFEPYINGKPQVTLFLEKAPLLLSVIHEPNAVGQVPGRLMVGQSLMKLIDNRINSTANEIEDSLSLIQSGISDITSRYYADDYELVPNHLSFIIDGPTFELIDPNLLRRNLKRYIGIRILHEIDVEIPQEKGGIGIFQTGDPEMAILDTSKPAQLDKWNNKRRLDYPIKRKSILDKWEDRLRLVDVVYHQKTGIDEVGLDHQLAMAVEEEWS